MIQNFLLPDRSGKETGEGVLVGLYCKIQRAVHALIQENKKHITIVIDDISLLEVAANGSSNHVLDFLHYCHTLLSEVVRPFELTEFFSSSHILLNVVTFNLHSPVFNLHISLSTLSYSYSHFALPTGLFHNCT